MNTRLDCEFVFGKCNGSMNLEVYSNDKLISQYINPIEEKILLTTQIDLPTRLKFVTSGKNHNTDTVVDQNGNIIADKYVILQVFKLGLIVVNSNLLFSICSNNNTFWGFNEEITIDIDEKDFIKWHLKKQNKFSTGNDHN